MCVVPTCSECKCYRHDVMCSKYISYHPDLDEKLKMIKTNNRYGNTTGFSMACDDDRNIYITGHNKAFLELLCSVHWSSIKACDFNKMRIFDFLIDTNDESEWSDVYCKKWFKTTYPEQVTFVCRKVQM